MKKASIGFITFLLLNASIFGQTSDINKIFNQLKLNQLKSDSLVETNFIDLANEKTIILTSLAKGCKWRLEEMAYYNKLKQENLDKLEVFVAFYDDIGIMSKLIQDVGFKFIYIYDPMISLSKEFFSNDTIYSVLFNSNGFVQEKTGTGNLDRKKILNELNKNKPEPNIRTSSNLPILNFQLKRFELGDEVSSNLSSVSLSTRIMTGYKANQSIDTIENIKFCTITGENILGLYSYAYDLPQSRFIYDNELEYVSSHDPDHRYTVSLSVSDLHADFNKMLIRQMDLNFGLRTAMEIMKTESLVLSQINLENDHLKIAESLAKGSTIYKTISESKFELIADKINGIEISKLIEEKVKIPVELNINPNSNYSVDISIESNDQSIENWIKLFSDSGLIMKKSIKETQYVIIKNGSF